MVKKNILLVIALLVIGLTVIHAQASGTFGTGLTWALSGDGTLTISGNGTMPVSVLGADSNNPWYSLKTRITTAVIEDSVTGKLSIGAFDGCSMLTSITIGKGITAINDYILRGTSITSIIIPEKIAEIEPDAFTGANKLETVYWNAANCKDFFVSPYSTGPFADTKTPALKTVVFGDAVIKIPEYTCISANAVTSLTIGKGVTVIGNGAFWGCAGLTSIIIPDNVQTINYRAFYQCAGITSITLGSDLDEIGINAFTGTRITELTIPQNVSKIRNAAFGNSTRLQTVYFNASSCENEDVDSPFLGSGNLESIIFADNVRQIPAYIARELTGLYSVTIGSRVNTIGRGAFMGCVGLEEIINKAARPIIFVGAGNAIFEKVDMTYCVLRVPPASVAAYKVANIWKDFTIEAQ